jgi:ribonuclease VapC
MIVDSSAIIAILRNEPEAARFAKTLLASPQNYIGSPSYLEVCMVAIGDRAEDTQRDVDEILAKYKVNQMAFSAEASDLAVAAFIKYGKGRRHKAQLNFGGCISYALSKTEAMPLLFKGEDFTHTDVECAI